MPRAPTIRSAVFSGYWSLAREVGLDPERLAEQAGVEPAALRTPDAVVRARCAYRLLEMSAAQSGLDDFGLRLASRRGLSHLGALGLQVRDESTVRSALTKIMSGLKVHSTCSQVDIDEGADATVLTITLLADGETIIRQALETAVGSLVQDLVALLGPRWRPSRVQFVHSAGQNLRTYRPMFGCPIDFSTDRNAIVMRSSDLDQPVHGADPGFKPYADAIVSRRVPIAGRVSPELVKQALATLLPQGAGTAPAVARELGVDRRTLHRHLDQAKTDFSSVLGAMRAELAEQYLRGAVLSMTEIAPLLGFASLGSFSRWFATRYGSAPTQWRRAHTAAE